MRERRKVTRYDFGITGLLYPAGGRVGRNVVIQDISTLGCALEIGEGPSLGQKCLLYIDWQGTQLWIEGQAVRKYGQGKTGLKFLPPDKDTQKQLNDLCAALRIQSRSTPLPKRIETAQPVQHSARALQPTPAAVSPSSASSPPTRRPGLTPEKARRRVPRYISQLPAQLLDPVTGATSNVALVTLSVLGACLEGPGLPAAGEQCEVHASWEGELLHVQCNVVWRSQDDRAGVKFGSLDAGTEKLLRRICADSRLEPLRPLAY
jgi:hypothetical protein